MDMGADVEIVSSDHVDPSQPADVKVPTADEPAAPSEGSALTSSAIKSEVVDELALNNGDGGDATQRPVKRRRVDDGTPRRSASRAASPPWKKFTADGPTTIITDDGRRKSGRFNSQAPPPPPPPEPTKQRGRRQAAKPAQTNGTGKTSGRQGTMRASSDATASTKAKSLTASAKKATARGAVASPPARKSERQRKPSTAAAAGLESPLSPERTRTRAGRPRKATYTAGDDLTDGPYSTPSHYGNGYEAPISPSESTGLPRLRLRLRKPDLPNRHPQHAPVQSKYPSFTDWLEQDDPLEGEEGARITAEKAEEEAKRRMRIVEAAERGVLSQTQCSVYLPEPAEEPPPHYGRWDHIVSHALHFGKLMKEEQAKHRRNAKAMARDAYEYWKEKYKRKTEEEIEQEEADRAVLRYKQLVKDVKDAWSNVRVEIDKERYARWEEEQKELGRKAMDDMFNKAREALGQGIVDSASSFVSDDRASEDEEGFGSGRSEGSEEEVHDENMSSSGDSDSEKHADDDEDANLTAEQLREKYGQLPDIPLDSSDASDGSEAESDDEDVEERTPAPTPDPDIEMEDASDARASPYTNGFHPKEGAESENGIGAIDPSNVELDVVDEALLDTEDEGLKSEESGSEEWPSEEESDEEEQYGSGSDGEEDEDLGVMGFLAPAEIKKMKEAAKLVTAEQKDDKEHAATNGNTGDADVDHMEVETPEEPITKGDSPQDSKVEIDSPAKEDEPEKATAPVEEHVPEPEKAATSVEEHEPEAMELTVSDNKASGGRSREASSPPRTEIPSLLRGTLREYQHDGLDWLANLYDSNTNGILADEMGLGKTIQTISLLAYIAVHREVWGPHLVVVPTSVMLNWEMEFKKWCPGFKILTYYGDVHERKRKRVGWRTTGKDMYNVVITSYQLILQDAAAFKQRPWQYLILDEAHNIKNFKSQRWQTMLNLRTERRLLLTGTPLQNNIDELWSLLYFLMPADYNGEGRIAGLEEFTNALKNPTSQILEQGRQKLDAGAQKIVKKLHEVLRPYLLRRLKADVEKQMPAKYEHIVYCKLSKRQRQLYDGFMGREDTKRTLASGNYMTIINCLMSLRKVCNHPDLFETRAIVTSMAMPKSVPAAYEIKDLLVRKRLLENADEQVNLDALNLLFARREQTSMLHARRTREIRATRPLEDLIERQTRRLKPSTTSHPQGSIQAALSAFEERANLAVHDHLQTCLRLTRSRTQFMPIYGKGLIDRLTVDYQDYTFGAYDHGDENPLLPRPVSKKGMYGFRAPRSPRVARDWYWNQVMLFHTLIPTLEQRAEALEPIITQFTCVTPAVAADEMAALTVSRPGVEMIQSSPAALTRDPFHESRIRQSIAFPDKRLLQYDCGKLQRLAVLLRSLQAGGHRALIFTQMTKVLDILEQFLNIHGHRYLRLDGATKVEQRQILTDRFNNDPRILCFILSSRSGGLGINLTGADTVIFYDLDWNPAMDKQCQDRSHRIGQTRDVHIYKFVSEYTIEANILRKSNQKRLLDDVIIQKGDFTTDYFNKVTWRDALDGGEGEPVDEAGAAMDRVLAEKAGLLGDSKLMGKVEDTEDQNAANVAQKEIVDEIHDDEVDFNESSAATPADDATKNAPDSTAERRHVDEYMLGLYRELYGKEPYKPPSDRQRKRNRKGQDVHRTSRKKKY
jgi:helicase SWR1